MLKASNPAFQIKQLVIIFFFYMIAEGILRKWLFPNLHIYIYFVKDFILMFIYYLAISNNYFFKIKYIKYFLIFLIIISIFGFIGYDFNLDGFLSYLLGVRSYWLYVPLFLIMTQLFNINDFKILLEKKLYFIFPYFILILFQAYLPDTNPLNSGFNSLVFNPERPSGYFTYTTQNTYYFIFLFACCYSTALSTINLTFSKLIYYSLLIFMLLSIMILLKSRAVYLFTFTISLYSLFFTIFFTKNNFLKFKRISIIAIITPILFLITQNIFKDDYDFSVKRINSDTYYEFELVKEYKDFKIPFVNKIVGSETTITVQDFCQKNSSLCRVVNEIYFIPIISKSSFIGHGIGSGTSAVSALTNEKAFIHGESENHRIVNELGYIVGTTLVLLKFFLVIIFNLFFLFKNRFKLEISPFLVCISVQMLIGAITYSASFINFIFWFCLGIFFISFMDTNNLKKDHL